MNNQRLEYRVVWFRDGWSGPQRALFQTAKAAHRKVLRITGRWWESFGFDPEAYACCSGAFCGCRGIRNKDAWEKYSQDWPALLWWRIETRPVGDWVQQEKWTRPVEENVVDALAKVGAGV